MQIPDEPKIPLDNYLLDLTDEEDGKENSVYLRMLRMQKLAKVKDIMH
jgi:hypothetical protein